MRSVKSDNEILGFCTSLARPSLKSITHVFAVRTGVFPMRKAKMLSVLCWAVVISRQSPQAVCRCGRKLSEILVIFNGEHENKMLSVLAFVSPTHKHPIFDCYIHSSIINITPNTIFLLCSVLPLMFAWWIMNFFASHCVIVMNTATVSAIKGCCIEMWPVSGS